MTLVQEAYDRIDNLSEDKIRKVIIFIDLIENSPNVETYYSLTGKNNQDSSRNEKIKRLFATAGKIQVDAQSIYDLRERSMI